MKIRKPKSITRTAHGWVVVQIDDSNEWIKIGETGHKLWLDVSFEPERMAQTKGTVVVRCEDVSYRSPYKGIPVEIMDGDEVVFHYLCVKDAMLNSRSFVETEDGEQFKYVCIPYENLFQAKRDDRIIALNGFVLIEPFEEKATEYEYDPNHEDFREIKKKTRTKSITRGIVKYVGCEVPAYRDYPDMDDEGYDLNPGDVVAFKPEEALPLKFVFDDNKLLYRSHRIFLNRIPA